MTDSTLRRLNYLIEDATKLRDAYVEIVQVGHTQRVHRDTASDRQSGGSHSDATGAAVTDMAACRRHTKEFAESFRRAFTTFQAMLIPAEDSLRSAFRAADRRRDERADSRIEGAR